MWFATRAALRFCPLPPEAGTQPNPMTARTASSSREVFALGSRPQHEVVASVITATAAIVSFSAIVVIRA